jgi:energy-coupling factor transport system substrate-specific component
MRTTAKGQPASGLWSVTARTLVYAGVGALIMGFMNSLTYVLPIPGTEVNIRPHYGILTFFGFAFGPIVGFLTGFLGGLIGDYLNGGYVIENAVRSWHWSVANGLVGLVAGLFPFLLASRMTSTGRRALIAAVASVVAVAVGFLFIFIELVIQPALGFDYILTDEYIPTVVANCIAAATVTPVLMLAWDPISVELGR